MPRSARAFAPSASACPTSVDPESRPFISETSTANVAAVRPGKRRSSLESRPFQAGDDDTTEDRRRSLASEANHEIAKLPEAAIRLLTQQRDDDHLIHHGILARFQMLSDINFFAMRLHGDSPEDEHRHWGDVARLENLERAFEGLL